MARRRVNFDSAPEVMNAADGWVVDGGEAEVGAEAPGPPMPDGLFARARQALINYDFSDPRIVVGHFDPEAPFVGRDMLLEIKVLGLRFLCGVRVHGVREERDECTSVFGFRYDTLEGHLEQGYEWFLLSKEHQTGIVRFRIEAHWRMGDFPSWWSRLGFQLVGERYRELWRRRAPRRLMRLARRPIEEPVAEAGRLAHRGGEQAARSGPPG
jgi:uncharacterized protein (UPF0548 family)